MKRLLKSISLYSEELYKNTVIRLKEGKEDFDDIMDDFSNSIEGLKSDELFELEVKVGNLINSKERFSSIGYILKKNNLKIAEDILNDIYVTIKETKRKEIDEMHKILKIKYDILYEKIGNPWAEEIELNDDGGRLLGGAKNIKTYTENEIGLMAMFPEWNPDEEDIDDFLIKIGID